MNEKEKGRSVEKRIRITDSIMNEQINRIMTLPGYTSRNNGNERRVLAKYE